MDVSHIGICPPSPFQAHGPFLVVHMFHGSLQPSYEPKEAGGQCLRGPQVNGYILEHRPSHTEKLFWSQYLAPEHPVPFSNQLKQLT